MRYSLLLADPMVSETVGCLGYDFIWIVEHSCLEVKDILNRDNAARTAGTPVTVRVPQHDLTYTKRVLSLWHGMGMNMISTGSDYKAVRIRGAETLKTIRGIQK